MESASPFDRIVRYNRPVGKAHQTSTTSACCRSTDQESYWLMGQQRTAGRETRCQRNRAATTAIRLSSTPKITRRRRMILHCQDARLRRSGASFCSLCLIARLDDSMLLVDGLRLQQSRRDHRRIDRKFRDVFGVFRQSGNQSFSVSSPNISSGVQMIGIGIPKSVITPWMRGRILAFAMCLQFQVNRYCIR